MSKQEPLDSMQNAFADFIEACTARKPEILNGPLPTFQDWLIQAHEEPFSPPWSDDEHRSFYEDAMNRSPRNDSYHRALFYTLGICRDTRDHLDSLYDFENRQIMPENLDSSWITSGSNRIILLAYNLFNGFVLPGYERQSTPYELFDYGFGECFMTAIRLRYPDSF